MDITLTIVDYHNKQHCADLLELLNHYASDPMGGGQALSQYTQANLSQALAKIPHALSIIAYSDNQAVGLANAFEGFSTFHCKPIMNIHDLMVEHAYRGRGISQQLLQKVESVARQRGCAKITLEVLAGNNIARQAYLKYGFTPYELAPQTGAALFWQKPLP